MSAFDNYVCDGQISMFDSIEMMSEEDIVERIGNEVGIKFTKYDDFWGWIYKTKTARIRLGCSRYSFGDERRFISCSYDYKNGGQSGPCESIEQAVNTVRMYLERMKDGKGN